jgi:hypothetical protein
VCLLLWVAASAPGWVDGKSIGGGALGILGEFLQRFRLAADGERLGGKFCSCATFVCLRTRLDSAENAIHNRMHRQATTGCETASRSQAMAAALPILLWEVRHRQVNLAPDRLTDGRNRLHGETPSQRSPIHRMTGLTPRAPR